MTEEWLMTLTDVAEALDCSLDDVHRMLRDGIIVARETRPIRIAHSEVIAAVSDARFVDFTLGREPSFSSSLLTSRPVRNDDSFD